jgi:hypothetical protein
MRYAMRFVRLLTIIGEEGKEIRRRRVVVVESAASEAIGSEAEGSRRTDGR